MYGRTDVHDEQRSGWPSVLAETIAKVEQEMLEDRHVTVRKLCKWNPEMSKSMIDKILTENLHYRKVCARWVTKDHKRQHVEAAWGYLKRYAEQSKEFFYSIFTGDEIWVHYTIPETKEKFISGGIRIRQICKSSNKHCLPAKRWPVCSGTEKVYCYASLCLLAQQ